MSYRRRMMISNAQSGENCLTFDIIAEAGQTFSWQPQGYYGQKYAAIADIGYGKQTLANSEIISRTYEVAGCYVFRIYECFCNTAYWRGDVNLVSSNEKWKYLGSNYAQLYSAFNGMSNSTLAFKTLPEINGSMWNCFSNCQYATLPLSKFPSMATNLEGVCRNVKNFAGNIVDFPESATVVGSAFYNCTGEGSFRLTRIPVSVSKLNSFASGSTVVYADLDEITANAPEGGYTALTTIDYAFYNCGERVTGSRSAFLAVCPNLTSTAGAFTNTNTTE